MEEIKEAFTRVKEDIDFLKKEMNFIKIQLFETREGLIDICEIISKLNGNNKSKEINLHSNYFLNLIPFESKFTYSDIYLDNQTNISTGNKGVETDTTHLSTHNSFIKPLNDQIYCISKGNQGVQTDRQTDEQTDRQTQKGSDNLNFDKNIHSNQSFQLTEKNIDSALDALNSLDNLKKEIRLKFKRLTEQELLVFSTIYQLEEEWGYSDYKSLSKKLKLTESSIRDYVSRLISKGIPVDKTKINNKEIRLGISTSLKKITSLNTILQLRDI